MKKVIKGRKLKILKEEFEFQDNRVMKKIKESRRHDLCVFSCWIIHHMRLFMIQHLLNPLTETWQSERYAKFKDCKHWIAKLLKQSGIKKIGSNKKEKQLNDIQEIWQNFHSSLIHFISTNGHYYFNPNIIYCTFGALPSSQSYEMNNNLLSFVLGIGKNRADKVTDFEFVYCPGSNVYKRFCLIRVIFRQIYEKPAIS